MYLRYRRLRPGDNLNQTDVSTRKNNRVFIIDNKTNLMISIDVLTGRGERKDSMGQTTAGFPERLYNRNSESDEDDKLRYEERIQYFFAHSTNFVIVHNYKLTL